MQSYIHSYLHICIHAYIHACMHTCMHVYMISCGHVDMQICGHVDMWTCGHMNIYVIDGTPNMHRKLSSCIVWLSLPLPLPALRTAACTAASRNHTAADMPPARLEHNSATFGS